MILGFVGATSNFLGVIACAVISYFSFKLGRLGIKRAFLLTLGCLSISIGLFIYGLTFLSWILGFTGFAKALPKPYWMYASLLILCGYFLFVFSYTIQTLRSPFQTVTPLLAPLIIMTTFEGMATILTLYLLLLVAYNTGKRGGRIGPLTVTSFFLFFLAQMIITMGLLLSHLQYFLLGVTIRGFGFLPLLLVTLKSS